MNRPAIAVLIAHLLLLAGCGREETQPPDATADAPSEPLRIAAASDLQPAFDDLASAYEASGGGPVQFISGVVGESCRADPPGGPLRPASSPPIASSSRTFPPRGW